MALFQCPECKAAFKAAKSGGSVVCPRCQFSFSTRGTAPAKRSKRSPVAAVVFGILALVFLGTGAATAHILYKNFRHQNNPSANNDPNKQNPNGSLTPIPDPNANPKPPDPNPPPDPTPTPTVDPKAEKQKKINAAIDKGAEYLKKELAALLDKGPDPTIAVREGLLSLMGLTLLECGVPANDPVLQKTVTVVRASVPQVPNVYAAAPAILFLDRLGDQRHKDFIQSCALRLIATQNPEGNWGYNAATLNPLEEKQLFAYMRTVSFVTPRGDPRLLTPRLLQMSVVRWLQGEKLAPFTSGDNSNTQFAILALWIAQRHDVPAYPSLAMAEQYFRAWQFPDGSYSYSAANRQHRASMTCTGLLGLAMGRTFVNKKGPEKGKPKVDLSKDPSIERAFRFLAQSVAEPTTQRPLPPVPGAAPVPDKHAGKLIGADAGDDLYFLWSLERVAMVYDLKVIGGRDWYDWASDVIVAAQKGDGSWDETYGPRADSCFALLVLKRVNVVQDLAVTPELAENIKKMVSIKDQK